MQPHFPYKLLGKTVIKGPSADWRKWRFITLLRHRLTLGLCTALGVITSLEDKLFVQEKHSMQIYCSFQWQRKVPCTSLSVLMYCTEVQHAVLQIRLWWKECEQLFESWSEAKSRSTVCNVSSSACFKHSACQERLPHFHSFHHWVTGTFLFSSVNVQLGCHVPGCHESGRRDTESRSRCEPHAFNPESRPQNHQLLKSKHSLTLQSAVFHQQVGFFSIDFFFPTTKWAQHCGTRCCPAAVCLFHLLKKVKPRWSTTQLLQYYLVLLVPWLQHL